MIAEGWDFLSCVYSFGVLFTQWGINIQHLNSHKKSEAGPPLTHPQGGRSASLGLLDAAASLRWATRWGPLQLHPLPFEVLFWSGVLNGFSRLCALSHGCPDRSALFII